MKTIINYLWRAPIVLIASICSLDIASAATVNSVIIQYDDTSPQIVVLGADLSNATFTLGGVALPSSCITLNSSSEQHIDFCSEAAMAVPGEGSYSLIINSTLHFSVYAEKAIVAPAPPPPPPTNNDCACVTGISTDGTGQWLQPPIPGYNSILCYWNQPASPYTDQVWISGYFTYDSYAYTISALWDPNNPTYDPANPGNSTSACALHNETTNTFEVQHPVASDEQFDACFDWMLRYGGPCL